MDVSYDDNSLLLDWARNLDSSIHQDQERELTSLRVINSLLSAFGNEQCIPVGSCIEGSKVNVPGDIGDVDILLISDKVVLTEDLFEYIAGYPAFLYIRCTGKHFPLFKDVKLVDGIYLPSSALKGLTTRFYDMLRFIVRCQTKLRMSKDENAVSFSKDSAVGLEKRELHGISADEMGIHHDKKKKDVRKALCQVGQFFNDAIDTFSDKPRNRMGSRVDSSQPTSSDENLGSTLFRIFTEIKTKIDNFDEGGESNDELIESEMEVNETSDDDPMQDSNVLPRISKLHISEECIDDELEMYFDNDFEAASTAEGEAHSGSLQGGYSYHVNSSVLSETADVEHKESANCKANESRALAQDGINMLFSRIRSTDLVPAFKVFGWPRPAEEWIVRKRQWPTNTIRDEIIKTGCQVVAKPLPYMSENENKVNFRLSFALSEVILANSMSESQMICWKILKAYQKGYLNTEPRILASYHWKTALLWISEPKSEHFWTSENVLVAVKEALDFMLTCLGERFVPHYFVREMNLIANCNIELVKLVKAKVSDIYDNPVNYLKCFIQSPPSPMPCKITLKEMAQLENESKSDSFDEQAGDLLTSMSAVWKKAQDERTEFPKKFCTGAKSFISTIKTSVEQAEKNDKVPGDEKKVISGIFDTLTSFIDTFNECDQSNDDDNACGGDNDDDDDRWAKTKDTGMQLFESVGTMMLNRVTKSRGKGNCQPADPVHDGKPTQCDFDLD